MALGIIQKGQIEFLFRYVVSLIIKADFSSAEDFFKDQLYRHFHDICNLVEDGEFSIDLSAVSDQDKVACWSILVLSIARGFEAKQFGVQNSVPIRKIRELYIDTGDREFFIAQSILVQECIEGVNKQAINKIKFG